MDTIHSFSTADGDRIEFTDVLDGHYNPGTDGIADFVSLNVSGSDTQFFVDLDGTGGGTYSAAQVLTGAGQTGFDLATLIGNGNLVVA